MRCPRSWLFYLSLVLLYPLSSYGGSVIQLSVATHRGGLNLREAPSVDGSAGAVLGVIPSGARVSVDMQSLYGELASSSLSNADREEFLASSDCRDLSRVWARLLEKARVQGQGLQRYIKVRAEEGGRTLTGYVAIAYLSTRNTQWSCRDLQEQLIKNLGSPIASCDIQCAWKSADSTRLIRELAEPLARLIGPASGDGGQNEADLLGKEARSLCQSAPAREPSAVSSQSWIHVPQVISTGPELLSKNDVVDRGAVDPSQRYRHVPTYFVQCDDPSMTIVNRFEMGGCSSSRGVLMSQQFYRDVIASGILEGCVRQSATNIPGIRGDEPVRLEDLGIYDDRETAEGGFSHHSTASAMDLSGVWIAGHHFDHLRDYRARHSSGNWTKFWDPLIRCLDKRILTVNVYDSPVLHANHIHVVDVGGAPPAKFQRD